MLGRIKRFILEYRELRYLAYHDSLTGLLNRNWLYKNIHTIKNKYVYFIDINDLHEINKQGHTIGYKHIKNIINTLNELKPEFFIRYAGDEFIIFSDNSNLLVSNELYSIGVSEVKDNIMMAINTADIAMIEAKYNLKQKRF